MPENFDLNKFKKLTEINLEALKNSSTQKAGQKDALSALLSLFDANNDNKFDKKELETILNQMKGFDRDKNSIFDTKEAESFIEFIRQQPNVSQKTLSKLSKDNATLFVNFLNETAESEAPQKPIKPKCETAKIKGNEFAVRTTKPLKPDKDGFYELEDAASFFPELATLHLGKNKFTEKELINLLIEFNPEYQTATGIEQQKIKVDLEQNLKQDLKVLANGDAVINTEMFQQTLHKNYRNSNRRFFSQEEFGGMTDGTKRIVDKITTTVDNARSRMVKNNPSFAANINNEIDAVFFVAPAELLQLKTMLKDGVITKAQFDVACNAKILEIDVSGYSRIYDIDEKHIPALRGIKTDFSTDDVISHPRFEETKGLAIDMLLGYNRYYEKLLEKGIDDASWTIQATNWLRNFFDCEISSNNIKEMIGAARQKIEELRMLSPEAFCSKYSEMTGMPFVPENILRYKQLAEAQSLIERHESAINMLSCINQDEDNYSLDLWSSRKNAKEIKSCINDFEKAKRKQNLADMQEYFEMLHCFLYSDGSLFMQRQESRAEIESLKGVFAKQRNVASFADLPKEEQMKFYELQVKQITDPQWHRSQIDNFLTLSKTESSRDIDEQMKKVSKLIVGEKDKFGKLIAQNMQANEKTFGWINTGVNVALIAAITYFSAGLATAPAMALMAVPVVVNGTVMYVHLGTDANGMTGSDWADWSLDNGINVLSMGAGMGFAKLGKLGALKFAGNSSRFAQNVVSLGTEISGDVVFDATVLQLAYAHKGSEFDFWSSFVKAAGFNILGRVGGNIGDRKRWIKENKGLTKFDINSENFKWQKNKSGDEVATIGTQQYVKQKGPDGTIIIKVQEIGGTKLGTIALDEVTGSVISIASAKGKTISRKPLALQSQDVTYRKVKTEQFVSLQNGEKITIPKGATIGHDADGRIVCVNYEVQNVPFQKNFTYDVAGNVKAIATTKYSSQSGLPISREIKRTDGTITNAIYADGKLCKQETINPNDGTKTIVELFAPHKSQDPICYVERKFQGDRVVAERAYRYDVSHYELWGENYRGSSGVKSEVKESKVNVGKVPTNISRDEYVHLAGQSYFDPDTQTLSTFGWGEQNSRVLTQTSKNGIVTKTEDYYLLDKMKNRTITTTTLEGVQKEIAIKYDVLGKTIKDNTTGQEVLLKDSEIITTTNPDGTKTSVEIKYDYSSKTVKDSVTGKEIQLKDSEIITTTNPDGTKTSVEIKYDYSGKTVKDSASGKDIQLKDSEIITTTNPDGTKTSVEIKYDYFGKTIKDSATGKEIQFKEAETTTKTLPDGVVQMTKIEYSDKGISSKTREIRKDGLVVEKYEFGHTWPSSSCEKITQVRNNQIVTTKINYNSSENDAAHLTDKTVTTKTNGKNGETTQEIVEHYVYDKETKTWQLESTKIRNKDGELVPYVSARAVIGADLVAQLNKQNPDANYSIRINNGNTQIVNKEGTVFAEITTKPNGNRFVTFCEDVSGFPLPKINGKNIKVPGKEILYLGKNATIVYDADGRLIKLLLDKYNELKIDYSSKTGDYVITEFNFGSMQRKFYYQDDRLARIDTMRGDQVEYRNYYNSEEKFIKQEGFDYDGNLKYTSRILLEDEIYTDKFGNKWPLKTRSSIKTFLDGNIEISVNGKSIRFDKNTVSIADIDITEMLKKYKELTHTVFDAIYALDSSDLKSFVQFVNKHPNDAKSVLVLIKKGCFSAADVNIYVSEYNQLKKMLKNNPQYSNFVSEMVNSKYSVSHIISVLSDINKYPELKKAFDMSRSVDVNFIAKSQDASSPERAQAREMAIKSVGAEKIKLIENSLGKDYAVVWENLIKPNASDADIKNIVTEIYERIAIFSRLSGLEQKYGKDVHWATAVKRMIDRSSVKAQAGAGYEEFLSPIADGYHFYFNGKRNASDSRRETTGKLKEADGNYLTAYNNQTYGIYQARFDKLLNKTRKAPFSDIELTQLRDVHTHPDNPYTTKEVRFMVHPERVYTAPAMKHISKRYDAVCQLINKVQSGQELTLAEKMFAVKNIAEMHFIFTNTMPFARGSAGIADAQTRSLYKALKIDLPPLRKDIALDLEAFCVDMDTYVAKWQNGEFFELPVKNAGKM